MSPYPNLAFDPEYGTTSIPSISATVFSNLLPRLRLFLFLVRWSIVATISALGTTVRTPLGFRQSPLGVILVLIAGDGECLTAINTLFDCMCLSALCAALLAPLREFQALLGNMSLEPQTYGKLLAAIHAIAVDYSFFHVTSPILNND